MSIALLPFPRTARLVWFACIVLGASIVFGATARSNDDADATVDFSKDVYPILKRACFECHGKLEQEGGLRLDRREDFFEAGTVEPGDVDSSELIRRIELPVGHDEVMPAVGDPLDAEQIRILRSWVADGSPWPIDFSEQLHWSYVRPVRPALPVVRDSAWGKTPVDRFVLRRLERSGIQPSPKATAEKLVRRVYLDLIGLPPTPDQVDAYRMSPTEERLAAIVDELLARPEFGQRWARHWLDLARYADSHGFQRDNLRDIWAYRDWVIDAINADMPFNQFTIEQIAGDLLPDASEAQRIATGFHRCTPTNVEAGSLPEETRIEQVLDRVNTTGAVWLGTTLECCQCHDHKYDPFSAKEYYQLLAFYNNTEKEADRSNPKTPSSIKFNGPSMPLSDPKKDAVRDQIEQQITDQRKRRTRRLASIEKSLPKHVERLSKQIATAPITEAMVVKQFDSEGNTDDFKILDDGSVLLVGDDPPLTDRYTVLLETTCESISAIRIDVLTDDSLPGKGPGRNERRNFVLHEFTARLVENDPPAKVETTLGAAEREASTLLEFSDAKASFSQKKWAVEGAVDGDLKTGWAISPKFGQPHWATFILKQPIVAKEPTRFEVTLSQQFGRSLNIGRFRLSAISGDVNAEPVESSVRLAIAKPIDEWSGADREAVLNFAIGQDSNIRNIDATIKKLRREQEAVTADTTLVMIELDKPRMTHRFERGDYLSPAEVVQPGVPAVLHSLPEGPPNRLTLARWLVDPANPLVARVTVNRWWEELFGQGIVDTPEDFGVKGDLPSHPELLDWLAVELMDNHWSMKHVLKQIVLSSTYQQASVIRDDLTEIDPKNSLLARGPRFRMDAEMIRDNALEIAGLLDRTHGGPSIRPFQPKGIWSKVGGTAYDYQVSPGSEQYRRGVYVVLKRGSPYPSFMNFDSTPRLACTVRRGRTNTPLQALTLLNDQVYVTAAKRLAERLRRDTHSDQPQDWIEHGFRLCTGREPNPSELATLLFLWERQAGQDDPLIGVATVLLNLHETITKD
ncbi:PSD1 and planctomycete cytochrome C domain-containing protein [Roseiconus lacunae]|uniref:PSD1 and planctomycete cytochrome C domain-containing protein n=1 Tax=Roseiconus lacunae TaxID=2605694 RepID=A0ABT7PND2_9BACT|nr:PSD1 and planctomycete cytochrome C domain-containing protein [Roseiconus lacunae]MDM4018027.1 PSD1 and planctomycete cytochrome C domain-containing protein [Roseiconus lacunae]